jgi:hypothetical protein
MTEQDLELERLMLDILAATEGGRGATGWRLRAFAQRILHERQNAINGALEEAAATLDAAGVGGAEMVRAMKGEGR